MSQDRLYVLFGFRKIRLVSEIQWKRLRLLWLLRFRITQLENQGVEKNDKS